MSKIVDPLTPKQVEERRNGITLEEMKERMRVESEKKNFRNWLNNLFPEGYGGYNAHYMLLHPWKIVEEWFYQAKYAWQRVFRGWDDRAVWSVDTYLAQQIVEIVGALRKDDMGTPMYLYKNFSPIEGSDWEFTKETDEAVHQLWLSILDDIVIGFRAYLDHDDKNFFEETNMDERYVKAFDLLRKYFKGLWN